MGNVLLCFLKVEQKMILNVRLLYGLFSYMQLRYGRWFSLHFRAVAPKVDNDCFDMANTADTIDIATIANIEMRALLFDIVSLAIDTLNPL